MKLKGDSKKLAYFLPNVFTALNMGCGFSSVLFAFQGKFYFAAIVIVLGSIFDSVDGRVARLVGGESAFGEQFDSISDVVTFGFAPAILVYNGFLFHYGRVGGLISFIFLLCGALRLARFNANIDRVDSTFFQGLPIPSGALAIVGYVLIATEFDVLFKLPYLAIPYTLLYAILMVSNIPFNSFKGSKWVKTHRRSALFIIFVLLSLTVTFETYMVILIVNFYVLAGCIYFFLHRGELKDMFKWEESEQIEDAEELEEYLP